LKKIRGFKKCPYGFYQVGKRKDNKKSVKIMVEVQFGCSLDAVWMQFGDDDRKYIVRRD
jgi:hypothetical protein